MRGPHDIELPRPRKGRGGGRGGDDRQHETLARAAASARKRERFPAGKALARIQYFELQRGLAPTELADGRVMTKGRAAALSTRGADGARALAAQREAAATGARYLRATRVKQRAAPFFAAAVGLPVWRQLGPNLIPRGQTYGRGGNNRPPVSGRCVGIVIDPTDRRRLLLCTAGGGIWGSQDAGHSWRPLTDSQPVLAMGAIANAPSSPNIVYAATGEGDGQVPLGVGLLRSSDGGATWTHVPAAAISGTGVYDLAVHPRDPMRLWVAADSGAFASADGGVTWTRQNQGPTWSVVVHPAQPADLLMASDRGLLRSSDGGASWSLVTLPGTTSATEYERLEACFAPSDPGIAYVAGVVAGESVPRLWRRATAGGTFTVETPPRAMDTAQAWYDWCLAVSPRDPNVVIWGGIELYRGTRYAKLWQWENISSRSSGDSIHADQHHLAFDPSDPSTLYVCNDGGLFRSPDGGTRWESLNPGLAITEFEFLAQLESRDEWVIGGTQDNGTLNLVGAGRWDQVALGDGGDCGTSDGASPVCYHSYYWMWIERAPTAGPAAFRWIDVTPEQVGSEPSDYPALFYPPMDVADTTLTKAGKTVLVSADSGETWSEVKLPTSDEPRPDLCTAISIFGRDTILVATRRGALYRLGRGRGGWRSATVTALVSPRKAFISDIVVVGTTGRVIWVACSAFGGGHVYRSSNGGHSWSDRTGNLPDIPVHALVVDPKNSRRVFAATDHGVYRSNNSGATWTDFSNGLPNAIVSDLILHARRRVLRAGTKNRGAWEIGI
jgi:photosystem II stability/assembly factor-like uncharacterized protein